MTQLASAAALLLTLVFCWAAPSKLRRPAETGASFTALGLPAPTVLARAVPVLELATATLLVVRPRVGAVAAGALLVAFTGVLARALRAGRASGQAGTVRCGCFGSADDAPVTGVTLLRNGLLLVACAVAAGTTSLHLSLAAVLALGTSAVTGLVVLALGDLRVATGHLFPSVADPDLPWGTPT